ncbi:DedA family protein [Rhodococcus erythropolis]|uniref:DedA family protein n=1 Tax=Rhodococcus erythropolis TaxID=1833 RepID=UPI0037A2EB17
MIDRLRDGGSGIISHLRHVSEHIIDFAGLLEHVPAYGAYALVGTAVLAESVLLVGAFVPTFTLLVTGGAMARYGHVNLVVLIAIAATAVVIGDFLAHRTGRTLHRRPLSEKLFRRVPTQFLRRTEALILRHGGPAVLASRFIPVVRTLTPHLVGMSDLSYRKMAPYSTVGALVWATAETTFGYVAATSLHQITRFGAPVLVALATLIAAVVVAARWAINHNTSRDPINIDPPASEDESIGSGIPAAAAGIVSGVDPPDVSARTRKHTEEERCCLT